MAEVVTSAADERPEGVRVVMYTRHGCHLCEDAWKLLKKWREHPGFHVDAIDVDSHADLARQYGERVPVLVVNGKERLWGRINRALLERMLDALGRN